MRVWIVCEHPDGWGVPTDMTDTVCGVFSSKEAALQCIKIYMSYFHSQEGWRLFLNEGKAIDSYDTVYYQIVEKKIGFIRPYPKATPEVD